MQKLWHPEAMPAISPTTPPVVPPTAQPESADGHDERSRSRNGSIGVPEHHHARLERARVPDELLAKLVVRLAGTDERDSIARLAARTGAARPSGAVMVAALDGNVL